MRPKLLVIVSLLAIVIAAPIVDAIACDDCKDIISPLDMRQSSIKNADHADGVLASRDAGRPAHQDSGTARDLCPICANSAVVIAGTCCGAPSLICRADHCPKLLAFSDPLSSITKPPQN